MSSELLRDPRVKFAGYQHPHPLENDIILRVQTVPGTHPTVALTASIDRLQGTFRQLRDKFESQLRALESEVER